jgi:hypothetical protein
MNVFEGFNRFSFGFAEPGERFIDPDNGLTLCMIGNFNRKKDAVAAQLQAVTEHKASAEVTPYLFGKLKRGWSVYTIEEAQP